jgi:hypothetical protein
VVAQPIKRPTALLSMEMDTAKTHGLYQSF